MLNLIARHNKALLALVGVLVNVAYAYNAAHPNAYLAAALVVLATYGVFQVPNKGA